MDKELLFSETQRFRQIWLWLILFAFNVFVFAGLFTQVFLGHRFGNKPMSDTGLIISSALAIGILVLFFVMRLNTYIKRDGIYVRFFPFQLSYKYYSWDQLSQSFVRKYNPIGEFGGWGLRGIKRNRAVNVSGNDGIQLATNDGFKLLIGTNKAGEASAALQQSGHWKS